MKLICTIPSTSITYDIEIRAGYLNHPERLVEGIHHQRLAVITQENLAPLYGQQLSEKLHADLFTFPEGEVYKTRETKQKLEDQLLEKGFGRDSCIIALGGGIVTDLAGYLAATYCRGVPFVSVPTTLLAMVDASYGGKTGVNTPHGKNLIGAIYQPKKVAIDPLFLKSLPHTRLQEGVVEMIKHGWIANSAYFSFLETHVKALLALDFDIIENAIFESCRVKKTIVEEDEKENGKRRLLNAGHTIGHALETVSNYTLSHGDAVAIGLLVEARMAKQIGGLSENAYQRLYNLLKNFGLPLQVPSQFSEEAILNALPYDKKTIKGKPRFVLLKDIGSPLPFNQNYCTEVDTSLIQKALTET